MNSDRLIKILLAYLKIVRPVNMVITFASLYLAGILCGGAFSDSEILYAALSAAFTAAGGNIINDVFDVKIDKINRPDRPLPAGLISKNAALNYYLIINLAAFSFAALINVYSLVIVLFSVTFIFFYCYHIKKVILIGNIVVSFLTGLAFVYGGVAVGNPYAGIIPGIFALLANLIREVVKDMQDIEGDKKNGIITLPQKYGINTGVLVTRVFTIVIILFTFIPFLCKIYHIEFFIAVMITANPLYVYIFKNIGIEKTPVFYGKMSALLKGNMVLGLIAIYLGIM
ncbi:MAG: prenyltransferase [Melioribacteraceae bacterium]|nr:MAG: prenyltransferase [Melioribacteraceae bacterium]